LLDLLARLRRRPVADMVYVAIEAAD
jgi:hypothetical protein